MWSRRALAVAVLLLLAPSSSPSPTFEDFVPCARAPSATETRALHAITCDTRAGWRSRQALKAWNVTGENLRLDGVTMRNVCHGRRWEGFITKPRLYLEYAEALPRTSAQGGLTHLLFMDSDTFWSVNTVASLWRGYDCARGGRDLLVSTEMSCWVGRYCNQTDVARWYADDVPPTFSPFVNSGVAMGTAEAVARMLRFVIDNQAAYFVHPPGGRVKFDDQLAIADYVQHHSAGAVALDFRQTLFGSAAAIGDTALHRNRQPFVCRNASGAVVSGCFDFSTHLARKGFYVVDPTECTLSRVHREGMELAAEMRTLSPTPVLWHANGVGRRTILAYADKAYLCYLRQRNMSHEDFMSAD